MVPPPGVGRTGRRPRGLRVHAVRAGSREALVRLRPTTVASQAMARTTFRAAKPGTGIAVQIDVEDAVGVVHQAEELAGVLEEEL